MRLLRSVCLGAAPAVPLVLAGILTGASCGVSESPSPSASEPDPSPSATGAASPGSNVGRPEETIAPGMASVPAAPGTAAGAPPATSTPMGPPTTGQAPTSPDGGTVAALPPRGTDAGAPIAPAPSGAGVSINGAFVPRERVVVFLHIGHSNMAGRATGPAAEKPLFYDKHPQLWSFRDKKWTQAFEPTAPDHETGKSAGPGTALLKAGLALAPTKHFVSIGFGMSGSTGGYCASFKKGGLFYDKVMGPALALKGNVTFGALFTMLGLTDRKPEPGKIQVGLSDCLKQVADDIRRDLGEPELPVIMSDYEMEAMGGTYTPTGELAQVIIKGLRLAATKISRSVLVPTEMLPMEDNHHFNLAGHRLWTDRAMKLMTSNGWAPWAK